MGLITSMVGLSPQAWSQLPAPKPSSEATKTKAKSDSLKSKKKKYKSAKKAQNGSLQKVNSQSVEKINKPAVTAPQTYSQHPAQISTKVNSPEKAPNLFSGVFQASRNTSLYDFKDGTRTDSVDYLVDIILNKAPLTRSPIILEFTYSQDLNDSSKSDFGDTVLITKFPAILKGKNLAFTTDAQFIFPTSKSSRDVKQLNLGVGPNFAIALTPENQISKNLKLKLSASLIRLFNKYTTGTDGKVLNEWASKQTLAAGYTFADKLYIDAELAHRNRKDYENNITEVYENQQEIGWNFNKNFSVGLGHTNAQSPTPGGDSTLYFLSENSSKYYGILSINF
ncbi:MAG: hypothetical protein ACOYOK_00415 [Pseudobdellovibrionaceae bacterium]